MSSLKFLIVDFDILFREKNVYCALNANVFHYETSRIHQRWISSVNMVTPTDTKFRK